MSTKIKNIQAREILSAGAFPTVETKITLENDVSGKASVPFGSSDGSHEPLFLIDNDEHRYQGKGVQNAISNVNGIIAENLIGTDVLDQKLIDQKLDQLDESPRKENLGGNSILSVSLGAARTASKAKNVPLFKHILEAYELSDDIENMPKPMMVMIEGGEHADNSTDIQEYLIMVDIDGTTRQRIEAGIEIYHSLAKVLKSNDYSINVGLEGAYAPSGIGSNVEPFQYITEAISNSGYKPGEEVNLAIDAAASEFFEDDKYHLRIEVKTLNVEEMLEYYSQMISDYPLFSIEDPFNEDDWDAWKRFKDRFGEKIMVVGDDLTVTQLKRLEKAHEEDTINSMIIKPNQAGTLSEVIRTIEFAEYHDYKIVVSHRGGGETTDTFIADLAVAVRADYIKTGPSRGERVVKYNRLMEIADELGL